ncbi:MAG: cysteine dioxygenase [bacterium]|nr:cysteine dioxygenase [bacterium]
MNHEPARGVDRLIESLNDAVALDRVDAITDRIKQQLESLIGNSELRLPAPLTRCCPDSYARRLLHRDEKRGYSVVVMTWGPGQRTALHDHSGMWCVECVVKGELEISQFDVLGNEDERWRFHRTSQVRVGVGEAGSLIPPFEYHVIANPRSDTSSVTLHVYGGEMKQCNLYIPQNEGWWQQETRSLTYDN